MDDQPTSTVRDNFQDLLKRARRGSTEALEELFSPIDKVFCRRLRRAISGRMRPRAGDSDVVQYAFVCAVRSLKEFNGNSYHEFLSWVWNIFERQLSDFIRFHHRERRDVRREVAWESAKFERISDARCLEPVNKLIAKENKQVLRAALRRLPNDYRRAIELHGMRELSFQDTGLRLGRRSPDAARMLYCRGMEMLRQDQRIAELLSNLQKSDPGLA